uniref:Uncharacterized protein n=1 Tax=Rhizophora mucronata TaxID=61149 RepID=A0A2P2N107_RHIMU
MWGPLKSTSMKSPPLHMSITGKTATRNKMNWQLSNSRQIT